MEGEIGVLAVQVGASRIRSIAAAGAAAFQRTLRSFAAASLGSSLLADALQRAFESASTCFRAASCV